jgi:hypothetical protein
MSGRLTLFTMFAAFVAAGCGGAPTLSPAERVEEAFVQSDYSTPPVTSASCNAAGRLNQTQRGGGAVRPRGIRSIPAGTGVFNCSVTFSEGTVRECATIVGSTLYTVIAPDRPRAGYCGEKGVRVTP